MTMTVRQATLEALKADPKQAAGALAAVVSQKVGRTVNTASVSVARSQLKKDGVFDWRAAAQDDDFYTESAIALVMEEETAEERDKRIRKRFDMQDRLVDRVIDGKCKSLIVSGPSGIGKSYGVEQALQFIDPSKTVKTMSGAISVPGLIIAAWETRNKGGILVLDDCDDLFRDETAMNILKAMLDSSDKRIITYAKNATWLDEYGIDKVFEYQGSVIFLTNLDFEKEIAKGGRMAPHFQAFIDRSLFLSLTLRTTDDFMCRLGHVSEAIVSESFIRAEIMDYIEANATKFHTLSARLIVHIYATIRANPDSWQDEVALTKMRSM